jgi:hypothetical protein
MPRRKNTPCFIKLPLLNEKNIAYFNIHGGSHGICGILASEKLLGEPAWALVAAGRKPRAIEALVFVGE